MELKRVLIQGKPYPVLYDMYGLARIMEERGISFGDLLQKVGRFQNIAELKGDDIAFIYDLVWIGFSEGCQEEKIEFPYSKRELSRFVPVISDKMDEIMAEFSRGMSSEIDQDDQKKAKKKTAKKAPQK